MCWDKHHQTTFRSKNFLFISIKHEIPAVVHFNVSLQTNKHTSSEGLTPNRGTVGITSNWDVSWVERASWQSFIPLCPVAYYIFLRTFHFSLSSSSPSPQQQVVAQQTPLPGGIQSESSRTTGASSNSPQVETQLQRRHQLVHRDAAIAATENMTQDAHLKKVRKTGRCNDRQQHAIRCE